jgi:hypothetical protein
VLGVLDPPPPAPPLVDGVLLGVEDAPAEGLGVAAAPAPAAVSDAPPAPPVAPSAGAADGLLEPEL